MIKSAMIKVLVIPSSKRLLKVAEISMAKQIRVKQKKFIFLEFVPPLQNNSNSSIPI